MTTVRQVLLIFVLHLSVYTVTVHCKYYKELETALTQSESNLEMLTLAFFPTDSPVSTIVDVYYHIRVKSASPPLVETPPPLPKNVTEIKHRVLREAGELQNVYEEERTLHFRWMQSSIPLFVEPDDLQVFSLYAFQTHIPSIDLTLDLPSYCEIPEIDEDTCDDEVDIIESLNELTSNMLPYAKHLDKSEVKKTENMGYSVLFFQEGNATNKTCVLDKDFSKIQIMIISTICGLALFFSIGTPTILLAVYKRLYKKMSNDDGDLQYLVWGVAMVAFLLGPVIVGVTSSHRPFSPFPTYTKQFPLYPIYAAGFFCVTFVTTQVLASCLLHVDEEKLYNFPVPHALQVCFCTHVQKSKCGQGSKLILTFLASWFFTWFLVLVNFHGIYMILSVVATPVVALSRIVFYITSFLCLVAFMAFFFKFSNKSDCDKLCTFDKDAKRQNPKKSTAIKLEEESEGSEVKKQGEKTTQGSNTNNTLISIIAKVLIYCPAVIASFLLFGCVAMLGALYYLLSIMTEDYRHSGGFISLLGTFFPSIVLGIATFGGKKLMNCLEGKDKDCKTDLEEKDK